MQRKKISVAILLCTYEGEKFLEEQLESFIHQDFKDWKLYVSDDHSSDKTLSIIKKFQSKVGKNRLIYLGPQKGFAAHFIDLTFNLAIKADYYAWSDQDDIWEKHKLSRAIRWLELQPKNKPAVFCSRTCLVDHNNTYIGLSPLFNKPKTFKNALVQNVGGANTMVFNESAKKLLLQIEKNHHFISHDWIMYQITTGNNGHFYYDHTPLVRYRQHDNNAVGMNITLASKITRLIKIFNGRYKNWNDHNIKALKSIYPSLTSQNKKTLDLFDQARRSSFFKRLFKLKASGVYRQSKIENFALFIAAIFNRI